MKLQKKRRKREDDEKERTAAECGEVPEANFVQLSFVLRANFDRDK